MRFYLKLIVILLLVCFSCKKQTNNDLNNKVLKDIETRISRLKTKKQKEQYLIDLFENDQGIRDPDKKNELLKRNNYDYKSKEYQNYVSQVIHIDSLNYFGAKTYLELFEYPDFEISNFKGSSSLYTVFLHQPLDRQLELFPYFNRAFEKREIDSSKFAFLLNKMHINHFGKSLQAGKTQKVTISQLMKKLNLNDSDL